MADADKLAAEMLDPNYAGELQHLRPWSEIDRIFREAAATITALEAENKRLREANAELHEAIEPFASDKLPALRRSVLAYDHNGLRRLMSPMEIAQRAARRARDISRNRRDAP